VSRTVADRCWGCCAARFHETASPRGGLIRGARRSMLAMGDRRAGADLRDLTWTTRVRETLGPGRRQRKPNVGGHTCMDRDRAPLTSGPSALVWDRSIAWSGAMGSPDGTPTRVVRPGRACCSPNRHDLMHKADG
jgi:hypothetical protein